jgi:glycosyltransferase involved in cell wall biosynthesis
MRILLVSEDIPYPNMGGLARHVISLARALARAGHEVDILGGNQHPLSVAGEDGRFDGRFFGELNGHLAGWKELRLGMFIPPRRTWLARRFARIIMRRAGNYDAIHYHGHVPNVARFMSASVNFVQTRHDQGSECMMHTRFRNGAICESIDPADCASCRSRTPNAVQRAVSTMAVVRFRREVAEGFNRHKTIFVSDFLHRNLARSLGPGAWGAVVHNFVDTALIEQVRKSVDGQPPRHFIEIFIAGKLYAAKGVSAFLAEFAARQPDNMRLTIAGDGPEEQRLRRQYDSDRIRFLGWCAHEKTLEQAARSHAIVVPSLLEESFGFSTLEGLLLGKPVFALERGGTLELADYAAPGQLRLFGDLRHLVAAVVAVDPTVQYPLPDLSRACADRAAQRLLDIYRLPPGRLVA